MAAARAAATWAHTRRASWTDQPLAGARADAEAPPVDDEAGPSAAAAILERARGAAPFVGRWVAISAAGAIVAVAAWKGGVYAWRTVQPLMSRVPASDSGAAPPRPASVPATVGELRVSSTPAGARVLVDGRDRGITPLTLTDVSPGVHDVTLTTNAGTVHRKARVAAGEIVQVDESIFPGWVSVLAPFDVEISEDGRPLRADEHGQLMLDPGVHTLQVRNALLDYATVARVEVTPGKATPLRVTPPSSSLTVVAAVPSEVWLDGVRIGETPLNAVAAPLGTHEVVLRRAGSAERRFTVTIGTTPLTLDADSQR